jgi:hypothetical protein
LLDIARIASVFESSGELLSEPDSLFELTNREEPSIPRQRRGGELDADRPSGEGIE